MTRASMLWRCSLAGIANGIAMLPLLAIAATIVFFGTAGGWGGNGVFFPRWTPQIRPPVDGSNPATTPG
jgi:hypothetical protein